MKLRYTMYDHGNPEMKFASLFEACEYLEGISQEAAIWRIVAKYDCAQLTKH